MLPPGDASTLDASSGERRVLTILMCDLAESTPMAESLAVEAWRDALRDFQRVCLDAIHAEGSRHARIWGDGMLAYFGYPNPDEFAGRSAVAAGLRITEALSRDEPGSSRLARVGIHTGESLVAPMGSDEASVQRDVVGLTPAIAARLQSLAEPGEILVSAQVRRQADPFFEFEALGPRPLKGVRDPVEVFRVIRPRVDPVPRADRGEPAFVGRERELADLLRARVRAVSAGGRPVLVHGDAGIGKSRLVAELLDAAPAADEGAAVVTAGCSPRDTESVLLPWGGLIQGLCGVVPGDAPGERAAKLEGLASAAGLDAPATALLADVAGVALSSPAEVSLDPRLRGERTGEAIVAAATAAARARPVILVLEDLHWADPSTLALVQRFVDAGPAPGLFVVLTSRRPAGGDGGLGLQGVEQLSLATLSHDACERLLSGLVDRSEAAWARREEIIRRSDGVPLYLERLARSPEALRGAVPLELTDLLNAEIDQLAGLERDMAMAAAVVGRRFTLGEVGVVLDYPALRLEGAARSLESRRIIEADGPAGRGAFRFRHELLRDAAYSRLVHERRIRFHDRIGDRLEQHGATGQAVSHALVAYHREQGSVPAAAIPWRQAAGLEALAHGASREAVVQFERAIELAQGLPEDSAAVTELQLQILLGQSSGISAGYTAEPTRRAFERALTLQRELGGRTELLGALSGLIGYHLTAGQPDTAEEVARLALAGAEDSGDSFAAEARCSVGFARFFRGDVPGAASLLEAALEEFRSRPGGYRSVDPRWTLPNSPAVGALSLLPITLWMMGEVDRAMALVPAVPLAVPPPDSPIGRTSLSFARSYLSWFHALRGSPEAAIREAQQALQVATEHGFREFAAAAAIRLGVAQVRAGHAEAGVSLLEPIVSQLVESRGWVFLPMELCGLAEGYAALGRPAEALTTLRRAAALADESGIRFHDVEIARLTGEVLLSQPSPEVEAGLAALDRAADVAREQGARALELRARVSRLRWAERLGRSDGAAAALVAVVRQFPGGASWPELDAARALARLATGEGA